MSTLCFILFFANVTGPLADQQHLFKTKKIRDHKSYYCTITITLVSDEKIGLKAETGVEIILKKKTIIWEAQTGLKDHLVYGFRV